MSLIPRTSRFDEKRTTFPTVAPTSRRTLPSGEGGAARSKPARKNHRRPVAEAVAGILALALIVLVLGRLPRGSTPPEPVAVLEITRGPMEAFSTARGQPSSGLLSLEAGKPILPGTVIDTRPSGAPYGGGRAALRLSNGASVRLDHGTRVEVASASDLHLERGALYIDAHAEGASVEVRTILGVVRDIGTQFEVRLLAKAREEPSLRIRVREGEVELRQNGEVHAATAGKELTLLQDGTLKSGTSPLFGPEWDWVLETAPPPSIDGRPLRALLEWATREGGWSLRFADRETEQLAGTITLHGAVAGLGPKEAAAIMLRGSRLTYRIKNGIFLVSPEG